MVKIGEDFDKKDRQREKRGFDWEKFWDNFPWFWIVVAFIIVSGGVEEMIRAKHPVPMERAVIIEYVEDASFDHYKIQFLSDRTVKMVDYPDNGYAVGDTVLIER